MTDDSFNRKEWIRCSAVAVGFYLIVYILLGSTVLSFSNIWLILGVIVFAVADVFGLKWFIREYASKDNDPYP